MDKFKVIIVEDVPLELRGTEGIFKSDIPEAEIIGTAESEPAYWRALKQQLPDLHSPRPWPWRFYYGGSGDLPTDEREISRHKGAYFYR